MTKRKVIDINKWPRTISNKKPMEQITLERQKIREDKIKKFETEANELLELLKDDQEV